MPENALTNKGHANRRPAVCKKSEPTDCPFGEIILETVSIEVTPSNSWSLKGHWMTPTVNDVLSATAHVTVTDGVAPDDFSITNQEPFDVVIAFPQSGQLVGLFLKALTSAGCEYAGSAAAFIPYPPAE